MRDPLAIGTAVILRPMCYLPLALNPGARGTIQHVCEPVALCPDRWWYQVVFPELSWLHAFVVLASDDLEEVS